MSDYSLEQLYRNYVLAAAGTILTGAIAIVLATYASGAVKFPSEIARLQSNDPRTVAYIDDTSTWGDIKIHRLGLVKPEVIIIGSSRGAILRSEMMRPYKFYNAALTSWTFDEIADFIRRIPADATPRVIILTLDFFMFSDHYAHETNPFREMLYDSPFNYYLRSFRAFVRSAAKYPFTLSLYASRQSNSSGTVEFIGSGAIVNRAGFRPDGSFLYPPGYSTARTQPFNASAAVNAFPAHKQISDHQMEVVKEIGDMAKARGITVIGVQFPITKVSRDYMDVDTEHGLSLLWQNFYKAPMKARMEALGIHFFDLARDPISDDDNNYFEEVHVGEVGMTRSILKLSEDPEFRAILPLLETDRIRADLARAVANKSYMYVYSSQ
jgi:hypothetical protein